MDNIEDFVNIMQKTMEKLPLELQTAAFWILKNMDIIDELLKNSYVTEEGREKYFKQAKSNHDYILLVLLAYQKLLQDNSALPPE